MPTEKRRERIETVLSRRQPDLRVVLEDVIIAHNASAVARTCEATGAFNLHIITRQPDQVTFNEAISTRAEKWLNIHFHDTIEDCLKSLREQGHRIAVTTLQGEATAYDQIDYCQPVAIVFGNESEGVSGRALELADYRIQIPMVGMVQSLNLSVSVGIILYEAFRQRLAGGLYSSCRLPAEEYQRWLNHWLGNPRPRAPFKQQK
ncbi:MAG: TrmH family RNA methyltransferase [Candidatus Saccharicenans sp.]|nr:TrmH family RNA methyltransferase [Candidatus Saccharicenans sp.]MDI6848693.1 TrmH family RNA methyltransferase [Candidatus Saccharicenans sp.]